jgi:hypothetical protein
MVFRLFEALTQLAIELDFTPEARMHGLAQALPAPDLTPG